MPRLKFLDLSPPPIRLDLSKNSSLNTLQLNFYDFDYYTRRIDSANGEITSLKFLSWHLRHSASRKLTAKWVSLSHHPERCFFPRDGYRTSPITELNLLVPNIEPIDVFPKLLQSIKTLQSLTFETNCSWKEEHMIKWDISPQSIGRSISYHAITLVQLSVGCNDAASFSRSSWFGTLTHFTCLKRLGIPETFLTSPKDRSLEHLLPSSLELLQLQYPMSFNQGHDSERPRRVERLEILAKNKDLKLPLLKHIIWWDQQAECWSGTTYGPAWDMRELRKMFQSIDVKFRYRNASDYKKTPLDGSVYGSPGVVEY